MKNLLRLTIFLIFGYGFSQVAINQDYLTSTSASLEFKENIAKGIVVPYVTTVAGNPSGYSAVQNPVNGTIIYDIATKKVRVMQNGIWSDLTNAGVGFSTSIQDDKNEQTNAKTIISKTSLSQTDINNIPEGILVLSDNDKGMILPKVQNPQVAIKNPAPGMIAYDTQTDQLAVFNGTEWSFWRATE